MFDKEEVKLTEWKEQYDSINIPLEKINQAIDAGYKKGKIPTKKKRKTWKWPSIAAAILLIGFLTTIRVSPTFAEYISTVPGMEKIVELISNNKGLLAAIDNEYAQEIGVSQEKNGMNVTIDALIKDDTGMVIFYSIKANEELQHFEIEHVELQTKEGTKINYDSLSFGNPTDDKAKTYTDVLEYYFSKPLKDQELQLTIKVKNDSKITNFKLPITVKKQENKSKVFDLNKTVNIEDQKIKVKKVKVDPLRIAVHLEMDPNNSKQILEFQDIRLVDQYGEAWSKIANGITSSKISANEQIVYLQSNYFKTPEELYLVFNKIQAVEKGDTAVIVDTEKQKIIQQPKGNNLSNLQVEGQDITFNLETEKEFNYFIFSSIKDAKGKEVESDSGFSHKFDVDGDAQKIGVTLASNNYSNPIELELSFYPSWIEGEVKMKLE